MVAAQIPAGAPQSTRLRCSKAAQKAAAALAAACAALAPQVCLGRALMADLSDQLSDGRHGRGCRIHDAGTIQPQNGCEELSELKSRRAIHAIFIILAVAVIK